MSTSGSFYQWCRRHISLPAIVILVFIIYMLFFNPLSCNRMNELKEQEKALNKEIKQENDSAAYYRELNKSLNSDPSTLERKARENFLMQQDDEDVYVVEYQ